MNTRPLTTLFTFEGLMALTGVPGVAAIACEWIGLSRQWNLNVTVLTFLAAAVLYSLRQLSRVPRVSITDSDRGSPATARIKAATKSVLVTHFSKEIPDEQYIVELLARSNCAVPVKRILPDDLDRDAPENAWLKRFWGAAEYLEVQVPWRLPFDVLVIDGMLVQVLFPDDHNNRYFRQGFQLEDEQVAQMFRAALAHVEIAAERDAPTSAIQLAPRYIGHVRMGEDSISIRLSLRRGDLRVEGTLEFSDEAQPYRLRGRFAGDVLTFVYWSESRTSTSSGSATLRRLSDGDLLHGSVGYRDRQSGDVRTADARLKRDGTEATRNTAA